MEKINEQIDIRQKTNKIIYMFGLKSKWVADQCKIPSNEFSAFTNGRTSLYAPQLERLKTFLSDYEQRMSGFVVK